MICSVNIGLAAMQFVTALLVKVSAFRYSV